MTTIQMTPAQWAQVEDNPIQRDTELHARKATRTHLKTPSSAHRHVHAAHLPDGKLVKLDGHTRSLLWEDGRLKKPEVVEVALHEVRNMQEAIDLYKHFDNPSATETATDRLTGAYRFHGISPRSELLTNGGISTALNIINQSSPQIYDMVGEWKDELMMLDDINATHQQMSSVLIAACLLTLRKHGSRALDFWRLYCAGGGTRIDGKSCGVDELTRIVADWRARRMIATGGSASRRNQAGKALSCCDSWLAGRVYSQGAKATDFGAYLESSSAKKVRIPA